jgi:hypothetical protein
MMKREPTVVCWGERNSGGVVCEMVDEGGRLARMWLGRGRAVAVGVADDITAECEGIAYADTSGSLGRLHVASVCRQAQGLAWFNWHRQASPEVLEIAHTLSPHWALDTAALTETAELLAGEPVTAPRA